MHPPPTITHLTPKSIPFGRIIPLYGYISAGFPSPAQDYTEDELDLSALLIKNPPATYKMRVEGTGMIDAGIFPGDILVIDRSLKPAHTSIVLAVLENEFVVRRLLLKSGKKFLLEEDGQSSPIEFTSEDNVTIWGVVTFSIHKCRI